VYKRLNAPAGAYRTVFRAAAIGKSGDAAKNRAWAKSERIAQRDNPD
jgi:hypothetical protein